jgi:hypothetical protein
LTSKVKKRIKFYPLKPAKNLNATSRTPIINY